MSKVENQDSGMKRGLKRSSYLHDCNGRLYWYRLFMTSGGAIHDAGALGALVAYAIIGAMVFFLMTSLEMATYLPVSGSFSTYATRFVDPSLGFALGWNYWFNWVITVAADVVYSASHSVLLDTYGRDTSMGMELYLYSYYFRIKLFICQSIW